MASAGFNLGYLDNMIGIFLKNDGDVSNDKELTDCMTQLEGTPIDRAGCLKTRGKEFF